MHNFTLLSKRVKYNANLLKLLRDGKTDYLYCIPNGTDTQHPMLYPCRKKVTDIPNKKSNRRNLVRPLTDEQKKKRQEFFHIEEEWERKVDIQSLTEKGDIQNV